MFNYIFLLKVPYLIYNLQAFSHNPQGFPGGSDGKESACSAGELGQIPGLGRFPRGGHVNPLQYSSLENPHRERSLVGYSPHSLKELNTPEHKAQYYSALKGKEILPHANRNEPGGHYAKRNKPVTKREIPHDTTYRRYLKRSNSQKQKVDR